jgi:hypothetical protein
VLPCEPPLAILPLAGAAAAEAVRKVPLNCALVQIRPGLAPGAKAKLVLPKGSVYNEVAGPTGSTQEVQVRGCCSPVGGVLELSELLAQQWGNRAAQHACQLAVFMGSKDSLFP